MTTKSIYKINSTFGILRDAENPKKADRTGNQNGSQKNHEADPELLLRFRDAALVFRTRVELLASLTHKTTTAEEDSMTTWWKGQYNRAQHRERLQAVPQVEIALVSGAGHMLHHDQPEQVASLMARFLAGGD